MNPYYRASKWMLHVLGGQVGGKFLTPIETPDPLVDLDAATKNYVDTVAAGIVQFDHQNKPYAWKSGDSIGWHTCLGGGAALFSYTMDRGYTYILPIFAADQTVLWDRIAVRVAAAAANSLVRMGFVELDYTNDLKPIQFIPDENGFGTVATTSTSPREKILVINQATVGILYLGLVIQAEGAGAATLQLNCIQGNDRGAMYGYSAPYPIPANMAFGLKAATQVSDGAFQTDFDDYAPFVNNQFPMCWARVTEVP